MTDSDPNADKPKHPDVIMTAADVLQEHKAAAADGIEPQDAHGDFGNPVAPTDPPPVPSGPSPTLLSEIAKEADEG